MFRRLVFLVLELHRGKKDEEEAGQMSETYPNIIDFHGFLLELDRTTRKPVRMIKNDMKAQKAVRPHLSSLLTHISVQSKSL